MDVQLGIVSIEVVFDARVVSNNFGGVVYSELEGAKDRALGSPIDELGKFR